MFFTKEDLDRIKEFLRIDAKKDTDFPYLNNYECIDDSDTVAIVHNNINCRTNLSSLASYIDLFLVSSTYNDKIQNLQNKFNTDIKDLLNQINSILMSGTALSNLFGDNPYIGVSLKTLTNSINRLWEKIEQITGEFTRGIRMTVTPDYYIGEGLCNVHVIADTANINDVFEHILFYINNTLIFEKDDVNHIEFDTTIEDTSIVKCVAKIIGIEYTDLKVINKFNSFFIGAGTTYEQAIDLKNAITTTNSMKGNYYINCNEGDYIYIIVGSEIANSFSRADMNGIEIPFNERTVEIEGKSFKVYESKNIYLAGVYNIDINS